MIEVHEVAEASAAKVWAVLIDTRLWPQWGPSVSKVEHAGDELHASSRGKVRLPFGIWVPFEVTDFAPGRSFHWKVVGVPATGHRVEAIDEHRSRIVFEVPTLVAAYALVCKRACRKIARLAERPDS